MLAEDIAIFLMQKGLCVYDREGLNGDTFIDVQPSSPGEVVSIYNRGGNPADVGSPYDEPMIQILLRGKDGNPFPMIMKGQEIFNALHGAFDSDEIIPGGTLVINCQGMQSGPNYIGKDNNGRVEYSLNFLFEIMNNTNIKRG